MKFSRYVYAIAGAYGLLIMIPQYFMEDRIGVDYPPAITHPEFFYGFIGVTLSCQILFLLIAKDPVRFRPVMVVAIVEKLIFAVTVPLLFVLRRVDALVLLFACIDLAFAICFIMSYLKTKSP